MSQPAPLTVVIPKDLGYHLDTFLWERERRG